MKIHELITQLQQFDSEQTVEIYDAIRDEFRHIRCVNKDTADPMADLIVELVAGDLSPELT